MTVTYPVAIAPPLALIGATLFPAIAVAQEEGPSGIRTVFGFSSRLEAQDNRSLAPERLGSSFEASMGLSFGLLTETRSSRFSFDAEGRLRSIDTPNDSVRNGIISPRLTLNYEHESTNAKLSFNTLVREDDLSTNDFLLNEDIEVIASGGATRRYARLEGRVDWGTNAPFGYGLLARYEDTSYRDGTVTGVSGSILNDSQRSSIGISTRLDFSKTISLNSELVASEFKEASSSESRTTISLDNRLTIDRPLGAVVFDLKAFELEEGTRVETALGRDFDTPLGTLSFELGATRGVTGDTFPTGSLSYSHNFPRGILTFGISRDVSSSNDQDIERLNTRLRFSYLQELTPLSSMRITGNWAETEETETSLKSANASFGATYSYALTQDWSVDVGYLHQYRGDSIVADSARSNTLFVELRRLFTGSF